MRTHPDTSTVRTCDVSPPFPLSLTACGDRTRATTHCRGRLESDSRTKHATPVCEPEKHQTREAQLTPEAPRSASTYGEGVTIAQPSTASRALFLKSSPGSVARLSDISQLGRERAWGRDRSVATSISSRDRRSATRSVRRPDQGRAPIATPAARANHDAHELPAYHHRGSRPRTSPTT